MQVKANPVLAEKQRKSLLSKVGSQLLSETQAATGRKKMRKWLTRRQRQMTIVKKRG
jgi:hypothetical protein